MRRRGAAEFRAAVRGVRAVDPRAAAGSSAASRDERARRGRLPVKDGARFLGELLDALAREGADEVLVIDSGSRDGSQEIARGDGRDRGRDRARGVRARTHAQPRRRTHERRHHRLSDAGRHAGAGLARRHSRGVRARPATSAPSSARTSRAPDTSPMIARELTEFFADFAPRHGRASSTPAPDVPVERQRGLPAGVLGGDPLRRRRLQRGPGVRARARRPPPLAQGLPPAAPRPARARLSAARVHAPLLRRVPRPARDDRPRRADRRALDASATCAASSRATGGTWRAGRGRRRSRAGRRARPLHHGGRKVFSALGSRAHAAARSRPARAVAGGPRRARRAAAGRRAAAACRAAAPAGRPTARLRGDRPCADATARHRCCRPVPGHGASASGCTSRSSIPPFHVGIRRPQHHLPALRCGSSGWATRARSGSTIRSATGTHERPARRCARDPRIVRAREAPGLPGLRATGTARTWSSPPAGRPSSPCSSSTACRARAYLVNDHEPEFYRDVGRVDLGRARPTAGPLRHRRQPVAARSLRRALRRHGRHVPVRRRPRRLLPAAGRAPPRHGRLLRARGHAAARRRARASWRSPSCKRRRPDVRIVMFGDRDPLDTPFAYEHAGVATPRGARVAVLGGDGRALPVADQLLAHAAGDAGLRAAVRRPRRRQHGVGVRRGRPGRARAVRRRRDRRRASSGCSTTSASGSGARRPGATFVRAAHLGRRRASRSSAELRRRCGCARLYDGRGDATRRAGSGGARAGRPGAAAHRPRWSPCWQPRSRSRSLGRSSRPRSSRPTNSRTSPTSSRSSRGRDFRGRRAAHRSPASSCWRPRSPTPTRWLRSRT